MKKMIALMLAVLMVLGMAACGSKETASADAFKLGGVGPLTGGAAIYGNAVKNAAEIAVEVRQRLQHPEGLGHAAVPGLRHFRSRRCHLC